MSRLHTGPLRILLVNPPFRYFPKTKVRSESYTRPPLGIAYLASYLKQQVQHPLQISLLDCEAEHLSDPASVTSFILKREPHVVGFSVVTGTFHIVSRLAQDIRRSRPDVVIVAGGPHITALPEEPMPGVDVKIFGEGEISFTEYLQEAVLGDSARPIPGCVQFRNGQILSKGKPRPLITPLDQIPIPSRELLRSTSYFHSYPYPNVTAFTTMFTSRGCPFNCNFCGNELLWKGRVRYHSLERVYDEVDGIVRQGINLIFFDDDVFTTQRKRLFAICDYLQRSHPRLQWICHVRADTVDREMLTRMKQAGCVEVQVGVEAGDNEVLRRAGKGLTVEQIKEAFRLLHDIRINSWATFILGNDGETHETIRKSIQLAEKLDPTYCSFIVLLPFPGTRVFEDYSARGLITTYDWSKYSWHGDPVIRLEGLSEDDLVRWRRKAYVAFYLRPRKLMRILAHVIQSRSMREIRRNFLAWLTFLGKNEKQYDAAKVSRQKGQEI